MYATIDIESTGLSRYKDKITFIGVGLAHEIGEPIFKYLFYDMYEEEDRARFHRLVAKLKKLRTKVIWQNGKFDTLFIEFKEGLKLPISEDVMLMGTAYDLAAEHNLKKMAMNYLGVPDWDIKTKEKTSHDFAKVKPYLKLDVKRPWQLFCYFMDVMDEDQMKVYRKLLRPAFLMYRDVERTGIYFDRKQYKVVKAKYKKIADEKLVVLKKKYDINWNSSQQKATILFTSAGEDLPVIKVSKKTGEPSADKKVLNRLAAKGYKLPTMILDYQDAATLNKMFLNRWDNDSNYDGRIHPCFGLTNVRTGRTSCSEPNLQQVPRCKDVRALYHAPKGRVFFEADYSQLELRIAAHYANEPTMLKIYHEGGDIHMETARILTRGVEPTKDDRGKAKAVNFGFIYGMQYKGFIDYAFDSYRAIFEATEAKHVREMFFAKYARLLPWHKQQIDLCNALGGVPNLFGRFRKLPDIYSSDWSKRSSAERISINSPVQGTGSDILLSAAIEIHKDLTPEGLCICGTIHDAIVGEFNEGDEEWMVEEIKKRMIHPKLLDEFGVKLKVNLDVDVGVGPWGTH